MASLDSFEVLELQFIQQIKHQILELQFQIQQLKLEKEELRILLFQKLGAKPKPEAKPPPAVTPHPLRPRPKSIFVKHGGSSNFQKFKLIESMSQ